MAERRMFAKTIIDSDAFLDMPLSTQALYFHLAMRADDDGFINNPKKIQRMIGASDDDCKILLMKRFILTFESGVIVIKHWKIHNYIRNDRYKPTIYKEEKALIEEKENKAYTEVDNLGIPNGYQMETQDRLGKDRLGKVSIEEYNGDSPEPPPPPPEPKKVFKKYGVNGWVKLTDEQYNRLIADLGEIELNRCIEYIDESAQLTGNKNKWKDWNLVIRRCSRDGWGLKQAPAHQFGKKPNTMQPSGVLGSAEMDNIRRLFSEDKKADTDTDFEAQAEEARRKIQELGSL
jgi:hypothetical protein